MNENVLVVETFGDVLVATAPDNSQRVATLVYDKAGLSVEAQIATFACEFLNGATRLIVAGPKVHTMDVAQDVLIFTSSAGTQAIRHVALAPLLQGVAVSFMESLTAVAAWVRSTPRPGVRLNHWRRGLLDIQEDFGLAVVHHCRRQLAIQTGYAHTGGVTIPYEDAPYGMTWHDIPRPPVFIQERLTSLNGPGSVICYIERARGSRQDEFFRAKMREAFGRWERPVALFAGPLAVPYGVRAACK